MLALIIGIPSMFFSYIDFTGIGYVSQAVNQTGIPLMPSINTLSSNLQQFSLFFPDLALLCIVILVADSWILSFYIKADLLGAVIAVFSLFAYTIASFFVSNAAVTVARNPVFAPIIASANPLLFFYINLPVILIICCVIDIAIAVTSSQR